MTETTLINAILAGFITAAVITDARSRRIPNALTLPVAAAAFAIHGLYAGPGGVVFALAGLGAGLGLFVLPYILGGMGGGDVKMLAAVGALKGATFAFHAFLGAAVAGGVMALALAVIHGRARRTMGNIGAICTTMAAGVNPKGAFCDAHSPGAAFPYAGAIAAGVVFAEFFASGLLG